MYKKIENDFIKKSYYKKTEIFILVISVLVVAAYLIGSKFIFNNIILQIILSITILIINITLLYLYVFFSLNHYKKGVKKIFDFRKNVIDYKRYVHDEDLVSLAIILEQNEINNSKKLEEALRHYRSILPCNIKKTSDLFSYISFVISLLALFSTDYFTNNIINVGYAIAFIILSMMLYWAISSIKSTMSLMFGKDELYNRIENTLSEIYIKDLIKK